jgi:hypothetical protein
MLIAVAMRPNATKINIMREIVTNVPLGFIVYIILLP